MKVQNISIKEISEPVGVASNQEPCTLKKKNEYTDQLNENKRLQTLQWLVKVDDDGIISIFKIK